jgi:hypothetical protein
MLALIGALTTNVIFILNGQVQVGEVVKESGNVVYVIPCENYNKLNRIQLNKREVDVVDWTCRDYNEFVREAR